MRTTAKTGMTATLLLASASANATLVGGIISTNTVWSDTSSPYTISTPVQIAYGASLTIGPGVQVAGGNIQVFGSLSVQGSALNKPVFNNTAIGLGATPTPTNRASININNAVFNGGSLYGASGSAIYGSLSLTNSILNNAGPMYIWYPTSDVQIQGNQFLNSGGISIGTNGNVTVGIFNNYFENWSGTYNGNAAVVNWASYDASKTLVEFNTFANAGEVAVMLPGGYGAAALYAISNYWGTTDAATIASMVYDNHLDLSAAGAIPYLPFLTASSTATPSPTPIPAAAWLLLSGLGGLFVVGRRREAQ